MIRTIVFVFVCLLVLPTAVEGTFIIDPFINGTKTFTTTAMTPSGDFTVTRQVSGGPMFNYNSTTGRFELPGGPAPFPNNEGVLIYFVSTTTALAPTFGNMYAALGGPSSPTGFSIGNITAPGFTLDVGLVDASGTGMTFTPSLTGNPFVFNDPLFAAAKTLRLTYDSTLADPNDLLEVGGPGASNLIATPEPTSLVLFGVAIGLAAITFRRRK